MKFTELYDADLDGVGVVHLPIDIDVYTAVSGNIGTQLWFLFLGHSFVFLFISSVCFLLDDYMVSHLCLFVN